MDYKNLFIKNNIIAAMGHVLIYARGIILLPILIKNIGTSLYGSYTLLVTGISFISATSTLGVGFKFKRFLPSADGITEQRNLFFPQLIFQLISIFLISFILIMSSNFIKATIFKNQVDFSMYLVIAILIAYVFYSASAEFFLYSHRMNYFTIATSGQVYLSILFITIAIYFLHTKTLNSLLLAYLTALVFTAIPFLVKVFKEIGLVIPSLKIKDIIEDIYLGFPLVLSYIMDFILSASDKYIIAIFISTTAVGFYSPAYTLGSLIILIPKVFGVVLSPLFSKATDSDDKNEVKVMADYAIKLFLMLAIPFISGCFILSKPLLMLLANKEVADAAYLTSPLIALATLFYGLNLVFSQIFLVKLKTKIIFGVNVLSALLNLVLNIIFIYIFKDIIVAAITTLISYLVSFIFLNKKIQDDVKISFDYKFIFKSVVSSAIMGVSLLFATRFMINSFLNITLLIILSGILYFLFLLFFKTFSEKEIKFIKSFQLKGIKCF